MIGATQKTLEWVPPIGERSLSESPEDFSAEQLSPTCSVGRVGADAETQLGWINRGKQLTVSRAVTPPRGRGRPPMNETNFRTELQQRAGSCLRQFLPGRVQGIAVYGVGCARIRARTPRSAGSVRILYIWTLLRPEREIPWVAAVPSPATGAGLRSLIFIRLGAAGRFSFGDFRRLEPDPLSTAVRCLERDPPFHCWPLQIRDEIAVDRRAAGGDTERGRSAEENGGDKAGDVAEAVASWRRSEQ